MWPFISIGLLLWESEVKYFGLGKIKEDQVIDYAKEECFH
jgi:hypothetical protein